MDTNLLLWIGQVVLAVGFAVAGYGHAFDYDRGAARPRMGWMAEVGRDNLRIIGILEILGAIGLIAPAATGILPWLTPLAAAALAVLMLAAAVLHARRPGETPNIVTNIVLGVFAAVIAYGRFVVAPL